MEWFVLAAPVPDAVTFNVGTAAVLFAVLVVAVVPVALALRSVFSGRAATIEAPQLRVIEGGKELSRRAA